jgi:dihydroorotase
MIDPHVHLRDWSQKHKETVRHGIEIAWLAGLDGFFEMPNTDPALTSGDRIVERIDLASDAIRELKRKYPDFNFFHGLYVGITADPVQIREVLNLYDALFSWIIGAKTFFGHSTQNMGIIEEEEQRRVWQTFAEQEFRGINAGHCEKESELRPDLWNPAEPFTHTLARPPRAEVESVKDQIRFAEEAGYKGTFHVCHVSVPETLEVIESARKGIGFRITCGVTPHHALLYDKMMKSEKGLLLKMNPPLRPREMQQYMLQALLDGRVDWIETDHAPHTYHEKVTDCASGIPVLPFYPHFIRILGERGMSEERLRALTHDNIARTFGIEIKNTQRTPRYNLQGEYEFDAFKDARQG